MSAIPTYSKWGKVERTKNKRQAYKERWWLFAEALPRHREALRPYKRYIGVSMVTKHLMFCLDTSGSAARKSLIVFAKDDDYFFGILHSHFHQVSARAKKARLARCLSYTPTQVPLKPFPCRGLPAKNPRKMQKWWLSHKPPRG